MESKRLSWFRLSVFLLLGIAIVFGYKWNYEFCPVTKVTPMPDIDISADYVQGINTRFYTENLRYVICEHAVEQLVPQLGHVDELVLKYDRTTGDPMVYKIEDQQVVTGYVIAYACPTTRRSIDFWVAVKDSGQTIEIIYET